MARNQTINEHDEMENPGPELIVPPGNPFALQNLLSYLGIGNKLCQEYVCKHELVQSLHCSQMLDCCLVIPSTGKMESESSLGIADPSDWPAQETPGPSE